MIRLNQFASFWSISPLSHPSYFWYDVAGLILQAGFLWYGALRLEKRDWLFGLSFIVTSSLSMFCAFWPVFDTETATNLRYALHTSTAVSFVALVMLIVRDYRERQGEGSLRWSWKLIVASFVGAMMLAWCSVWVLINLNVFASRRAKQEIASLENKANASVIATTATYALADTNRVMLLGISKRIDSVLIAAKDVTAINNQLADLQDQVWMLKMEVRRYRLDQQKTSIKSK